MLTPVRRRESVPAIGYAVVADSSIIDLGVSGYRKYRTRDSVKNTDRFNIGTNSFAFVSWIAGKLVEAGKIKWTTTYLSLFPEYKSKILPRYAGVDLKSLLSNTAGIPPYKEIDDFANVPTFQTDPQAQRKEFAAWVLQRPGLSEDRAKKMAESVAGYTIAVAMLERASGLAWDKLMEIHLNKALGISAKFGWPNIISDAQPWGHWAKYGGLSSEPPETWVKPYPATIPASGMNISLGDYAKFIQDELKGLRGGKAHLSQRSLELIIFGIPEYSFGWENGNMGTLRVARHVGESALFNAYVEIIPEKNIGIIVVCNDGDSMGKGAVINLCRAVRDSLLNH